MDVRVAKKILKNVEGGAECGLSAWDRGYANFHEKAIFVKGDVATATTVHALAVRAMLPSALSVSLLLGGSVHHGIRLFGLLKVLQSSDRPLLCGVDQSSRRSRLV